MLAKHKEFCIVPVNTKQESATAQLLDPLKLLRCIKLNFGA